MRIWSEMEEDDQDDGEKGENKEKDGSHKRVDLSWDDGTLK